MLLWAVPYLLSRAQTPTVEVPERTSFQTGAYYSPNLNIPADIAIVYGFGNNMPARIASWRNAGYDVQLMTGVAWGQYQDYLYGRFDGKNHVDEAQTRQDCSKISHGGDVYYMSPGPSYGKYLAQGVLKALDQGVDAIYLEEPEFWVAAGYGAGFKREWQDYYGSPWQAPDSSNEAEWKASKLKYFLYRRALQQVFDAIQAYNREHGRDVKCYVATHSLLNYSSWRIVSPESSLAQLDGCDGYIAQVWTGTARTPNTFDGVRKERTFETAFLEYGAMMNVARATGKTMWFLADPVEDDPKHDWGDYRRNYESTIAASLFQPDVNKYEVMPWPERVFGGPYPSESDPSKKTTIPPAYETELQLVENALNRMVRQDQTKWESGSQEVGILVSDSLMFERAGPNPSDGDLSHIYALALPFLSAGMPIQPLQLETANEKDLSHYKLIVATYQGMKPLTENADQKLVEWVKSGGVILFVDDDSDPYNSIREWWNEGDIHETTPRQHLFQELGAKEEPGIQHIGVGVLDWLRANPDDLAKNPDGSHIVLKQAERAAAQLPLFWHESNYLSLQRGIYNIVWRNEEPGHPYRLKGYYVNLFDPTLQILHNPSLAPGEKMFLINLQSARYQGGLLAAAGTWFSRLRGTYEVSGVEGSPGIVLAKVERKPAGVLLDGQEWHLWSYDSVNQVVRVSFTNHATPRILQISE